MIRITRLVIAFT